MRAYSARPKTRNSLEAIPPSQFKGKHVLVRVDFNVPMDKKTGTISDDTRLRAALPTLSFLQQAGAKTAIATHLGRPGGVVSDKYRLTAVAQWLKDHLDPNIVYVNDCIGTQVSEACSAMKDGGFVLLENVRFHAEEEQNDPNFAKQLVEDTKAQIYVNDAFGTAHRAHASTAGVCGLVSEGCLAGFLMDKELHFLQGTLHNPKRPFVAIVGGAKVSSKTPVLSSLSTTCDTIVLGGAMIFTVLKSRGLSVGSSKVEDSALTTARDLERKANGRGVELYIPTDVVVANAFSEDAEYKVVPSNEIPDGWMGMDIGPKSIEQIRSIIAGSKTVLWNGPLGVFEMKNFANGTVGIAQAMAEASKKGTVTIVGGGETVAAVEMAGVAEDLSHVSTGGGASLELLEGQTLPGVAALDSFPFKIPATANGK